MSKEDFAAKIKKMQDTAIEKNTIREVIGDSDQTSTEDRKALSIYMDNNLWQWIRREAFIKEESKSSIVTNILVDYANSHPNNL